MNDNFPFILVRHAESQHNVAKKQVKRKNVLDSVKNSEQYQLIRVNPSFRDQLITQQGAECAKKAGLSINWDDVGVILVSPMKRCLQTCRQMLSNANRKIDVFAQPLLKGRLSNIWGYGHSVEQLKCSYPQYNFDSISQSSELPWYIQVMQPKKQHIYIERRKIKSSSDEIMLEKFQQNYHQFKERVQRLQQVIKKYINKMDKNKKIMVISHSCLLRTIKCQGFNQKGKGISSIKFKNCEPVMTQYKEMFKWLTQDLRGLYVD